MKNRTAEEYGKTTFGIPEEFPKNIAGVPRGYRRNIQGIPGPGEVLRNN